MATETNWYLLILNFLPYWHILTSWAPACWLQFDSY